MSNQYYYDSDDSDDDLETILAEHRRELNAYQTLESDHDLAFNLQLQEALTASLLLQQPSTTPDDVTPPTTDDVAPSTTTTMTSLQSEELSKLELETRDRKTSLNEFGFEKADLHRRIHDRNLAREILEISEDHWISSGDSYEKPFGEGSSSSNSRDSGGDEVFRVYFKGLVSEEEVRVSKGEVSVGIGVAICDSRDDLVFEMKKSLNAKGKNRQVAELMALIEGLRAALSLDLKRLNCFVDYFPLFKYIMGKWTPKSHSIASLVKEVFNLQNQFTHFNVTLVARNDVKFAFKLAREAILCHKKDPVESSSSGKIKKEGCVICLEEADIGQIFSVDNCLHRYCFSCMRQHVEAKLLHGMLPKCPHEGCNSELTIDSCRKFLTPKLIEIMSQRLKEASIPAIEKIYCPYPRCSALMSKSDLYGSEIHQITGQKRCRKCTRLFCVECKVPWHLGFSCINYKRLNPYPREDAKLKSLATQNLWRQCVKCNHMIELAEGCYHMTCRCGYEFCYTFGAEWKEKKASCTCPLWAEENIIDDDMDESDFEDYEDNFDDYEGDTNSESSDSDGYY